MSDYIKREDAIEAVKHLSRNYTGKGKREDHPHINFIIDEIKYEVPSADVAPVRHGRWIVGDSLPMHDIAGNLSCGNWYTCNQCEFKTYAIERHITQYNYCPNCGAKMDGEDNEL